MNRRKGCTASTLLVFGSSCHFPIVVPHIHVHWCTGTLVSVTNLTRRQECGLCSRKSMRMGHLLKGSSISTASCELHILLGFTEQHASLESGLSMTHWTDFIHSPARDDSETDVSTNANDDNSDGSDGTAIAQSSEAGWGYSVSRGISVRHYYIDWWGTYSCECRWTRST